MTYVTAGRTFGEGDVVNRCHGFFCFDVVFPTSINICVLMAAILGSAAFFGLIFAVSLYTLENPSVA